jgi:hypothetical protein
MTQGPSFFGPKSQKTLADLSGLRSTGHRRFLHGPTRSCSTNSSAFVFCALWKRRCSNAARGLREQFAKHGILFFVDFGKLFA